MRWLTWLTVLVALAGCSQAPVGTEEADDGRDPAAVVAALRSIDPCALIGGGVSQAPHHCSGPDDALVVAIGVWRDPETEETGEVLDLAGAKAVRKPFRESCVVELPVGASLVIRFSHTDGCDAATEAARGAVGRLASPPLAAGPHLDACTLLARAEPDGLGDLDVRFDQVSHGLDLCNAREADRGGWYSRYSVRLLTGAVPTASNERMSTLDGKPVAVYETAEDCEYSWDLRPDLVVRVKAPDCASAEEMARTLMPVALDPADPVEPQNPITVPA